MNDNSDSDSDHEWLDEEELDKKKKYQPSNESALKLHLEEMKSNYIESVQNKTTFPQWHPLLNDPITISSLNPDDWYLANAWSYMWDSLRQ